MSLRGEREREREREREEEKERDVIVLIEVEQTPACHACRADFSPTSFRSDLYLFPNCLSTTTQSAKSRSRVDCSRFRSHRQPPVQNREMMKKETEPGKQTKKKLEFSYCHSTGIILPIKFDQLNARRRGALARAIIKYQSFTRIAR